MLVIKSSRFCNLDLKNSITHQWSRICGLKFSGLWCKMLQKQPTIVDNGQKTPICMNPEKKGLKNYMRLSIKGEIKY